MAWTVTFEHLCRSDGWKIDRGRDLDHAGNLAPYSARYRPNLHEVRLSAETDKAAMEEIDRRWPVVPEPESGQVWRTRRGAKRTVSHIDPDRQAAMYVEGGGRFLSDWPPIRHALVDGPGAPWPPDPNDSW